MRTSWKSLILILAVLAALLFSAVRSGAQENQQERRPRDARLGPGLPGADR